MAAILFKWVCYEPCRLLAKCCDGFCECLASACECCGTLCEQVCAIFNRPFSGCLFTTIIMMGAATVYAVAAIAGDSDDCGKPLGVYLGLNILFSVINILFAIYLYRKMNGLDDESNERAPNNQNENNPNGPDSWEFFKNDPVFACYILFYIVEIAMLCVGMGSGASCSSGLGRAVVFTATIILIFLGIGTFILLAYVCLDILKQASGNCCWWLVPCLWPCLFMGLLAQCWEEESSRQGMSSSSSVSNNASRPARSEKKPIVSYQQPAPVAQPVRAVQPQGQQPQVVYGYPSQPVQARPVYQAAPQTGPPPHNPHAGPMPGQFVQTGNQGASAAPVSQPAPVAQTHGHSTNEVPPQKSGQNQADNGGTHQAIVSAVGRGARGALGLLAKGVNKLDEKYNQREGDGAAKPAEGGGGEGY